MKEKKKNRSFNLKPTTGKNKLEKTVEKRQPGVFCFRTERKSKVILKNADKLPVRDNIFSARASHHRPSKKHSFV